MLKTYREWSPTQHDTRGLNAPDRQDWLVCPVIRTRDSETLDQANYEEMLARLEPHADDYEELSFGHWACGWFNIIVVRPDTEAERLVKAAEEDLESYPILSENRLGELEVEKHYDDECDEHCPLCESEGT